MRWKTFLQIALLIIFAAIIFYFLYPFKFLRELKLYPFRYEYVGKEIDEAELTFTDQATQQQIRRYIPINYYVVVDKWTGKVYKMQDFPDNILTEIDVVNKKIKIDSMEAEVSTKIDWKKAEEKIKSKLFRYEVPKTSQEGQKTSS